MARNFDIQFDTVNTSVRGDVLHKIKQHELSILKTFTVVIEV